MLRSQSTFALALLGIVAVACSGDAASPTPDVTSRRATAEGEIVGYAAPKHEAHVWKGIPFAAPPTGDLRWRAPEPAARFEGVRERLTGGSPCVQLDLRDAGAVKGDEDCLFLDVYAPKFAADAVPTGSARLPVMVWIHGGGNSIGDASVYDGSRLASEHGVIVVSIQYRLGVLGWFAHPALRASAHGAEDASGNFGTLDSIRALEWVRENAAAFGGNPDNVTIFGESAGGINVFALLLSPRAEGLFQRAISQSGILVSFTMAEAQNYTDAESPGAPGSSGEVLLKLLELDGRADDRASAKGVLESMKPEEIESLLRGKTPEGLLAAFGSTMMGGMYFSPNILRDGHVVVDLDPTKALGSKATHNAVPTIAGTNREETKLFSLFGSPYVRRVFGLPMGVKDQAAHDLGGEYGGLLWKAQGADGPLEAMRSSGRNGVYGYRFDWDEEGSFLWINVANLLGASHAIEIPFVFGFTDLGRFTDTVYEDVESAEALSLSMRSYWTQFAIAGAPGRGRDGDLPIWSAWGTSADAPEFMVFDTPRDGGLRMSSDTIDVPGVVAKLRTDARIRDAEHRCEVFRDLMAWSGAFSEDDYLEFADGMCAEFPYVSPFEVAANPS